MRFEIEADGSKPGKVIRVALSERNLRTLLAKLGGDPPDSACTIFYSDAGATATLYVTAEPDDVHYANAERDSPSPGPMHPDTEAALRKSP